MKDGVQGRSRSRWSTTLQWERATFIRGLSANSRKALTAAGGFARDARNVGCVFGCGQSVGLMAVFANESGRGFLFGQVRLGQEYRR